MTRISDLTEVNQVSGGDLFPIDQGASGRTRSVSFQVMKDNISAETNAAVEEAVEAAERAEEAASSADAQVLREDLATEGDPAKGAAIPGYDPEVEYTGGAGFELNRITRLMHRNLSSRSMVAQKYQFGGTLAHYLSDNSVVINGDSVTQGANAGYYMDNGWAYKVKRALMEAYQTKSYGYLNVSLKQGFVDDPTGAYRWYQPTSDGTVTENEFAPNSIGGAQVTLGVGQYFQWEFNRADKWSKDIIPAQTRYRIVFNDSTGSVRVTASGSDSSIDTVIATSGTGTSAVLALPSSWDGTIRITQETGAPVINGIVLMEREDAYCIHMIYNGGRATDEISDDVYSKLITNADLYIHALGINDFFTPNQPVFEAKMATIQAAIEASQTTKCLVLDFGWVMPRNHYVRQGLRALARNVENETVFIDVPQVLANGGPELSTDTLKDPSYLWLSSDGVHPFLNGHQTIANLVLAELGLEQRARNPSNFDNRQAVLQRQRSWGYSFGHEDWSSLIVGWTATSGQTVVWEEGAGVRVTGNVSPAYIETMIPVNPTDLWRVEIELFNDGNTDGRFNAGTRSYNVLGQEIIQQDSVGSLSGNLVVTNLLIPNGERRKVSFVVGGENLPAGTDASKLEPGAAYFNLAFNINNGWSTGSLLMESITVKRAVMGRKHIPGALSNSWVKDGTYLSVSKDAAGWVRFAGAIKSGTANTTAFNIPAEWRPDETVYTHIIDGNGNLVRVVVYTTGNVDVFPADTTAGWNTRIPLNSVTYPTGQANVVGN